MEKPLKVNLIYVWPDTTWCDKEDYYQYANWMSDDFEQVYLTEKEYDKFIETGDLP